MKYNIRNNFIKIQNVPCNLIYGDLNTIPEPKFSVVIPTYKRADTLKDAIESAVNQKEFNSSYEIIVVDNNDAEEITPAEILVRKLNIPNLLYYRNKKNIGVAGNWNRCMMLARAKWVVMCHDDDWMNNDCLSVMERIIEKHSSDKLEIGYIRSNAESYYSSDIQIQKRRRKHKKFKKERTAVIHHTYRDVIWNGGATWSGAPTCGTLINKEAFLKSGGYNEELMPCPDCYVPYQMLGSYNVFKTYYCYGKYRWAENSTYKKEVLLGLIKDYSEFLEILSKKHWVVKFFSNEHYADCVKYYTSKGREAKVEISDKEIDSIRVLNYSKIKLNLLYFIRKINSGIEILLAR